jgi:two-component system sensor histidine kinase PilS (NtrC family)
MPVDEPEPIPVQQDQRKADPAAGKDDPVSAVDERGPSLHDSGPKRRNLEPNIEDPGPTVEDLDRQLRMLMLLRVAAASAVLVATLYIQFLAGSQFSLRPLFAVTGLVYGFSILFALTHRWGIHWPPYAAIQLSVDVVLETLIIYFMGGVGSPFVVLYLLTVVAAGFLLTPRGAIYIAGLTAVCYGLVGLSVYVISPLISLLPLWFRDAFRIGLAGTTVDATELYLRLFSLLLVSYGVAWASSWAASRLRQASRELRVRESQVEALERLNERIIEGMSSGLLAADTDGTVVTFNTVAKEITGRSARQLVGHKIWEVFSTDADLLHRLDKRLRSGGVYRTERLIRTLAGEWRTIGMSAIRLQRSDLELNGLEDVYVFQFRDLTNVKRMERELRIRDRMAVLGEMAGSIAHEIRNPLGSISGSLQILKGGKLNTEEPQAQELMDIVIRESERLSKTIDGFLEYARPGPFEPEQVDLLQLVKDTIALLANSVELRPDHKLEVLSAPGAYISLVDPAQIRQVFWNLARNAIQAMPGGGQLTVSLGRTSKGIEVVFEDTGSGMSSEDIEAFFQPYVSGSARGTGLGLAVVYRILTRHEVNIEVESEVNRGTRFLLTFPSVIGDATDEQLVLPSGTVGPRDKET